MSILNSVFDDEHGNKKPVGTKITHSNGKVYVKESTGWYNANNGIKLDYKSSLILESAVDYESNSKGDFINGQKLTPEQAYPFKGLHYRNGKWVNADGNGVINQDKQDQLNNIFKKTQKEIEDSKKPAESIKGKGFESNKDGYYIDGQKLTPEQAKPFKDLTYHNGVWTNKDSSKGVIDGGTQLFLNNKLNSIKNEIGTNNKSESKSEVKSTPVQQPEAEPEVKSTPVQQPQPEVKDEPEQKESSTISSSIPNGYVYSSGKGNKYIMKNGTWYSVSTKKPVLSSNVNMLNRAAEKSIENFNATSDVKIGAKVTSNAGTEYTFNGTGFTNPNGKLLTGGAAQSAMNKLKQQATPSAEPEAEVQDAEPNIVPGESAIDTNPQPQAEQEPEVQSNTDTAGPSAQSIVNQGENAPQQEPSTQSNSTAPVNEPNPTSSPNEDTGPLQNLAKQIKGNKYAKQIVQLLSRGGNVNLIAADVLLKGNISEVIGELNALNNSNTQ